MSQNLKAFLDMIAISEGTPAIPNSDNGYKAVVGGGIFQDYQDHPRMLVNIPRLKIKSTAAGRYQILSRYFDIYKKQLGLRDFSPESQDLIAIQMIKECRAIDDIEAGNIEGAIDKCKSRWASLYGSPYGQHTHGLDYLIAVYEKAGGGVA